MQWWAAAQNKPLPPALSLHHTNELFKFGRIVFQRGTRPIENDMAAIHDDRARRDIERLRDNQLRTLDQLPTAVAVFDSRMQLSFCNSAWLN